MTEVRTVARLSNFCVTGSHRIPSHILLGLHAIPCKYPLPLRCTTGALTCATSFPPPAVRGPPKCCMISASASHGPPMALHCVDPLTHHSHSSHLVAGDSHCITSAQVPHGVPTSQGLLQQQQKAEGNGIQTRSQGLQFNSSGVTCSLWAIS